MLFRLQVFKNGYVRNMTLLTPVDSGDYVCGCDSNFTGHFCPHWSNASACGRFWSVVWQWWPKGPKAAAVCVWGGFYDEASSL